MTASYRFIEIVGGPSDGVIHECTQIATVDPAAVAEVEDSNGQTYSVIGIDCGVLKLRYREAERQRDGENHAP